ncbi:MULTISPECIES: hypothetical protein [Clostridium]|uniref:Uncharacterized protein n=2 Tax=Clostridium TaxID=1485 RepID=D8GK30_CLOLD|nr:MULTISPECIES: hypothetical protein [Clostridium]ADK13148.1 hypothetical protein CLJU_c00410 [Clostridium ljungdahlii DSM 13528]AGY76372.1 hypothetical protein CAETHG_2159 [Clostridium autoethanogenum DSM 10061]ALU36535.1 Hypothetical protein CLAU_2106 [Clostridium autoethanogenum DSM 10061]OAA84387.1 hypothetical protein WX45_01050 [Clostridium ljungdahlii DSM 13528]OVY48621.1 hypothetical protein WX72_00442 [Clostridium autoethanogenum]
MRKTIAIVVIVLCIIAIGIGGYKYKENKNYQKALIEQTRFTKYFKTVGSIDGTKVSNKDFIDKSISSSSITKNDLKQSHVEGNKYVVAYKFKHKDTKGIHDVEVDAYYYKKQNGDIFYKHNNMVFKQDGKVIDADWVISIALYDYYKANLSSSTGKAKSMIQNVISLKNKYKDLDLTDLSKADADNVINKDELAIAKEKATEEEQQRERAEEEKQRERKQIKDRISNSQNSNVQVNQNSNINTHPTQAEIDEFRRMWYENQLKDLKEHEARNAANQNK